MKEWEKKEKTTWFQGNHVAAADQCPSSVQRMATLGRLPTDLLLSMILSVPSAVVESPPLEGLKRLLVVTLGDML